MLIEGLALHFQKFSNNMSCVKNTGAGSTPALEIVMLLHHSRFDVCLDLALFGGCWCFFTL
jgi:hypothetical protein